MVFQRLRRAWRTPWQRTLFIMFFAQLVTAVGFASIFPFLPLYVKSLGSSSGMRIEVLAGLVYSGQALTMAITAPLWGAVADRYGRKLMVERSMFGGVLILLLMAFARSAEDLVLLRTLQGLITGTVAAANALVASIAPREQSGYAMGLLQMGQGAGVAVGPLIGGAIADQWGYSAAFYVTAVLLLIGGLLVMFGIDEHFERLPSSAHGRARMVGAWREILASQGVTVTYATSFLNQLGRNLLIPILPLFIPLLLATADHTNTFTGVVISVSAVTTTLSGLYFGRLGDRVGHRKIVIVSMLIGGLLYLPQALVTAAWQVLAMQALLGVAIGGMIPSISALLARYTRPGLEGAVYGLENSIGSGARALAPMLGSSIAMALGLRATFLATGGLLILTALFASIYLPRHPDDHKIVPAAQPAALR